MKTILSAENDFSANNLLLVLPMVDGTNFKTLAANIQESLPVPAGAKVVILTAIGAVVYCRPSLGSPSVVVAVPSADGSSETGGVPLPDGVPRMFRCHDMDTISVVSAGTPFVMAEFLS